MDFLRNYKFEIILFCAAFGARLVALWIAVFYYGEQVLHLSDSQAIIETAQSIAAGGGFALRGLQYFSGNMPGYPAYLAVSIFLFNSVWPALFGQMAMASLIPVFLVRVVGHLKLSRQLGFYAALIAAVEPHLVFYSITYMSEALHGFLFFLIIFFLIRFLKNVFWRELVISGVLLGLSAYVKEASYYTSFLFLAAVAYYFWNEKGRMSRIAVSALLFGGIVFIVVFPWLWRNHHNSGVWGMSAHGAYNFYVYDGASLVSLSEKIPYAIAQDRLVAELEKSTGVSVLQANDLRYSQFMFSRGLTLFKQYARTVPVLALLIFFGFWTAHNYSYFLAYFYRWIAQPQYLIPPTQLLFQGNVSGALRDVFGFIFSPYYLISVVGRLLWLAIGIASWFGVWYLWRSGDRLQKAFSLLAVFLFLYFSLAVFFVGLGIDGRMRYPIEPLIILFAAICITYLWKQRYDVVK